MTYVDKIIQDGKPEHMQKLKDIFNISMEKIKEIDPKFYDKEITKLKGMAYGYKVDKDLAQKIVNNMKPLSEYWSMDDVISLNDNHRLEDMYVVMNSLANDYKDIISLDDTDTYSRMAKAWIDDEDGKEHKLWKYFIGE